MTAHIRGSTKTQSTIMVSYDSGIHTHAQGSKDAGRVVDQAPMFAADAAA